MTNYKNKKDANLDKLLFSQHEDSHNLSDEHSTDGFISGQNEIDEINEEQDAFIYRMGGEHWNSGQNIQNQFLRMNGPSVEFSQNYSQNSMMLSHRQDDDSREYKRDREMKYLRVLQQKKKEEIEFNAALEKQLESIKQQLEKKEFQNTKLKQKVKGLQLKITKQDNMFQDKDKEIDELAYEVERLNDQKKQYLKTIQTKDDLFKQYRNRAQENIDKLAQKQHQNNCLRQEIDQLKQYVEQLSDSLSIYQDGDRNLLNFRGKYTQSGRESPLMRNSSFTDKELDKLRKQKSSLEIELTSLRDKLEDRENRFKKIEEEQKKKLALKEKKLTDVEQKLSQLKEDQMKLKASNEIQIQKLNSNISIKNKQIITLTQRLSESERRIKSLQEQSRKKDEKTKEVSIQLAEKNRSYAQLLKSNQEMKIKSDFDHQMIEDKDKEIQRMIGEKKVLKNQLEAAEKDSRDKLEKNEKDLKSRKQLERLKRQNQTMRKQNETLKKQIETFKKERQAIIREKEELVSAVKENKKKFEEVSKKMVQFRTNNTEIEEEMRNRQEQFDMQREALDKAMRELTELKKKNETVPQLRNKIILLESRLKNQQQYRDENESMESQLLQDRIQALEQRLQQKDKQCQTLKKHIKTTHNSDQQMLQLEQQLAERDHYIENLQQQLQKKEEEITKLNQQLTFKDNTLDFTHNILVTSQKAKIQLEQERNMLKEMLQKRQQEGPLSRNQEELTEFYQHQLEQLERKLEANQRQFKQKEDNYRFELKQQKERIRELNDMLLSKQRKFSPQTMSQEQTCAFLTKTFKRVVRSSEMLKMLGRSHEFRESLARMDRQFRK